MPSPATLSLCGIAFVALFAAWKARPSLRLRRRSAPAPTPP
jgi:hypothetical protein